MNINSTLMGALCLTAICLASEGCATPLGSRFGEVRRDRPAITSTLGTGMSGIRGFDGNRMPVPVPSNIPLPAEATPSAQFTGPSLGNSTSDAVYEIVKDISVNLNCAPDLSGKPARRCIAQSDRDFRRVVPRPPVEQKAPVILR